MKRMKKYFFALVIVMVLTSLQVLAGNKEKVTEQRKVSDFEQIVLKGSPTIKYTQGDKFNVEVKAPKNIIKDVRTHKGGKRLIVSIKSPKWSFGFGNKDDEVTVYVTSPDLIGVELLGSGDFECRSHLDTDNLDVMLKGSGDIVFSDIICDRIKTSVIGSGDLTIEKAVAQTADVELIGSGDVKIKQQKVKQTKVELKGSGDIKMALANCGTIDCRLLGSGDITLQGDVMKLNSYTRGSGDIDTQGLKIRK
jgi:hypothetical protein